MEKDIDRIPKNPETDIVIRVDDFGGKKGLTIREFVKSERFTGFTKAGTRIPAEQFKAFREAINSIDENDLAVELRGEAQEMMENPKTENSIGKKREANRPGKTHSPDDVLVIQEDSEEMPDEQEM